MSDSKKNLQSLTQSDYIRYLYQEGQRNGAHTKPNFYSELIKFVNSPLGQEGFLKFSNISAWRIGIPNLKPFTPIFKRVHL